MADLGSLKRAFSKSTSPRLKQPLFEDRNSFHSFPQKSSRFPVFGKFPATLCSTELGRGL